MKTWRGILRKSKLRPESKLGFFCVLVALSYEATCWQRGLYINLQVKSFLFPLSLVFFFITSCKRKSPKRDWFLGILTTQSIQCSFSSLTGNGWDITSFPLNTGSTVNKYEMKKSVKNTILCHNLALNVIKPR